MSLFNIAFILNLVEKIEFVHKIINLVKEKGKFIFSKELPFECEVGIGNYGLPEGICYTFKIDKREYILKEKELDNKIGNIGKIKRIQCSLDPLNLFFNLENEKEKNPIDAVNFRTEEEISINPSNETLIDILNSFYMKNNSSEKLFRFIAERLKKKNLSLTLYFPNTDMLLFKIPFNNLEGKDFGFPDKLITMISKSK